MATLSRYPTFYQAMEYYFAQEYETAYPTLLSFAQHGSEFDRTLQVGNSIIPSTLVNQRNA